MKEHKHAEVLRQIADGVPLSEFEIKTNQGTEWVTFLGRTNTILSRPEYWEARRKPQYIMVNGFKVPKPLDVLPSDGNVYGAAPTGIAFYASADVKYEWSRLMISRGVLHAHEAAAIAHAKAMLGIDPQWET